MSRHGELGYRGELSLYCDSILGTQQRKLGCVTSRSKRSCRSERRRQCFELGRIKQVLKTFFNVASVADRNGHLHGRIASFKGYELGVGERDPSTVEPVAEQGVSHVPA